MVKMEIQAQVQAQVNTQAKPETKSQIPKVSISSEERAAAVHIKNGALTGVSLYRRPYAWFKRLIDILLSLILLIPSGLIIAVCYIAIKLETKGPAFFVQERPGYKGKVFKILKLRTMIVERERNGRELSDMERMTKMSSGLDMRILFTTIKNVLNHQGINAGVNDTMQVFQGNGASLASTVDGAK